MLAPSPTPLSIPFVKMHGIGNDFVIVDARSTTVEIPPQRIAQLSDRHRGIGCDQFIILRPDTDKDAAMQIFNQDGTRAGACGNATRCVAQLVFDTSNKTTDTINLTVNQRSLVCHKVDDLIEVNMGAAAINWRDIPLAEDRNTQNLTFAEDTLKALGPAVCVNMGNPHCVFFVEDADAIDIKALGPELENHALFPDRANIEFVSTLEDSQFYQRTWERGVGETLACGSGACAVAVAAYLRGMIESTCRISLKGGDLQLRISPDLQHIHMTGPAAYSFSGHFEL